MAFRRRLLLTSASVILLTACGGAFVPPASTTPGVDMALAVVDHVEVGVDPGASPPQVSAILTGSAPDSCTQIGWVEPYYHHDEKRITLTAYTKRPQGAACAAALTHFRKVVLLDFAGRPNGAYVVEANGTATTFQFNSEEAFAIPVTPLAGP